MSRDGWKKSTVYQIYPMSFLDTNGDGIGDLRGIASKADYLADLGIGIVWVCPFFQSPMSDNGYDISDFRAIDPRFGSMEDFLELVGSLHERGIRLIMDLVVNHCSEEHPWFQEARKSRESPYHDYFIWRDPKPDGSPPNNWRSYFSGSAWKYEEACGQYFLHLFTDRMPDLNWENPRLRREVFDIMRFWVDKGVDGFRLDSMHAYHKETGLPDGDPSNFPVGVEHYSSLPETHEYVAAMHAELFEPFGLFAVGETDGVSPVDARRFSAEKRGEVNMVVQFQHMDLENQLAPKWFIDQPMDMEKLRDCLVTWQRELLDEGWNCLYLSNHDQARQVSRFGCDSPEYRALSAKMLATMMHLQRGTPFVYQGEELGMTNFRFESFDDVRDVEAHNAYVEHVATGFWTEGELLAGINRRGRDNARTPMQWTAGENAGFTSGTPWIRVNANHRDINAESQRHDPDSVFAYYKELIRLRKEHAVLVHGDFRTFEDGNPRTFLFGRKLDDTLLFVAINPYGDETTYSLPTELVDRKSLPFLSNYDEKRSILDTELRPYEAKAFLVNL
jgi:oligo-1,6-glucosidase